jgi:hypothetical protein
VLAYLMYEEKLLLKEALFILKDRRKWVNPNMHFLALLSDLEYKLAGVRSVLVVQDDRERAHLEYPENVELPHDGPAEGEAEEHNKKKKKKKKGKKDKKKDKKRTGGTLRFKSHEPEPAAPQVAVKRLKADKFAWDNADVYTEKSAKESRRESAGVIRDYRDKPKLDLRKQ